MERYADLKAQDEKPYLLLRIEDGAEFLIESEYEVRSECGRADIGVLSPNPPKDGVGLAS